MKAIRKKSWQQLLKDEIERLKNTVYAKDVEIRQLKAQVDILSKIANSPPTIMIACEKIVDAAAQLTVSATSIIDKQLRLR